MEQKENIPLLKGKEELMSSCRKKLNGKCTDPKHIDQYCGLLRPRSCYEKKEWDKYFERVRSVLHEYDRYMATR